MKTRTLGLRQYAVYGAATLVLIAAGVLFINNTAARAQTVEPVISNIVVSAGTTGATITWQTDEGATSQISYGTSVPYSASSAANTSLSTTDHSVTLSYLEPGSTYHFDVMSTDASGNTSTSSDQTFITAASGSVVGTTSTTGTNTTDVATLQSEITLLQTQVATLQSEVQSLMQGSASTGGSAAASGGVSAVVSSGIPAGDTLYTGTASDVSNLANGSFTLTSSDGSTTYTVDVASGATVWDTNRNVVPLSNIQQGDSVRIDGSLASGGTLNADVVRDTSR